VQCPECKNGVIEIDESCSSHNGLNAPRGYLEFILVIGRPF
jgi:hypothetical protein